MARFLLQGPEEVALARRPVVLRVQAGAGTAVSDPYRWSTDGADGPPVVIERPNTLILPRLTAGAVVTLLPPVGQPQFAPRTQLVVTVGADGSDPEADYVQLSVDVSGLPVRELVRLEPRGDQLFVAASGTSAPERPMSPMAELARDTARELLGVPKVAADQVVDVVVGLDSSPSMRPFLASGLMHDTLEVIAGAASVLDPDGEIEAVLCGASQISLASSPVDRFATATVDQLARQPLVSGCRSSVVPRSERSLAFFVTDALPADLSGAGSEPADGAHLVILGAAGSAARSPESGVTVISDTPPGSNTEAREGRWDRAAMRGIVASLLVDALGERRQS